MDIERRYDIDWLRVIAIGLLLIYHIAIVFQPWALFIGFIKSNEALEVLWKPMSMLNVWRIPFLFFVSGMGVFFAMQKRDFKALMIERSKRILLPFLFGVIAIVPLHVFIFQKFYKLPFGYSISMGHLWFLGNIFMYVLILSPLFIWLKKNQAGKLQHLLSKFMSYALAPFSVTAFFVIEALVVNPGFFELYAETWHGFFMGFLAFLFGFIFVYSGNSFWQTVSKWKWLYLAIAAILYILRLPELNILSTNYAKAIESNCWIFGVFGLGYQYFNKPSKLLRYLSQAAYPVYIIHMFVLFTGALFILPLEIAPVFQFLLLTLFTFLCCFLIYEFILRRISFLKPLFGLKSKIRSSQKIDKSSVKKLTVKIWNNTAHQKINDELTIEEREKSLS